MTGLVVDAVTWSVGASRILTDVRLEVAPGELVAMSGPSGSGKTTLLNIAGGLIAADHGGATFGGSSTWTGSGDPRPDVAFVLQTYGLVPILSARENVSIALRARGVAPREADQRADDALGRLSVGELADRQIEELSGGQMQRVAGARALVVQPALLLADEPTSELDEFNRDRVLAELRAEAARGASVLVATHDNEVVALCDREYHLVDGVVVRHSVVTSETSPNGQAQPSDGAAGASGRHRAP